MRVKINGLWRNWTTQDGDDDGDVVTGLFTRAKGEEWRAGSSLGGGRAGAEG